MSSYSFKVVLLGQGCVGKTSLLLRYVSNVFNESHESTLQASFLKKQLYLDQDLVRLNIWDTAGQEKFHALGPIYYREANGALLVYDVTSPDSLRKVRDWVRELNKMLGKQNVCLAIIGNKSDLLNGPAGGGGGSSRPATSANNYQLQQQQQESQLVQEAVALADELQNARHYLTSAKLNQGIGELFVSLAKRMLDQHKRLAAQRRDSRLMLASSRLARSNQNLSGNNNDDDDYYNENTKDQPRVIDRARRGPATSGASKANAGSCQC